MDPSPAPPGAFVELDPTLIDEGRFIETISAKLRAMYRDLLDYEKTTGDMKAKGVLTVKVKLMRTRGTSEFFDIEYGAATQVPCVVRATSVKEAAGKLLCQPAGSNEGNPDQTLFYDAKGRIIGGDPADNTESTARPLGRIGRSAQA